MHPGIRTLRDPSRRHQRGYRRHQRGYRCHEVIDERSLMGRSQALVAPRSLETPAEPWSIPDNGSAAPPGDGSATRGRVCSKGHVPASPPQARTRRPARAARHNVHYWVAGAGADGADDPPRVPSTSSDSSTAAGDDFQYAWTCLVEASSIALHSSCGIRLRSALVTL